MAINDVCRLCLATDDLVYIFDEKCEQLKMKDIVSITTGIEIHKKDIISQKICEKCYQFSIKVFQFRGQCLKADKYLKGLCMDYLVDKKYYIPNTEVSIKGVVKNEIVPKPKPLLIKQSSVFKVHPSVIKLSRSYPELKLPRICLNSDVAPFVEMELGHVENYFKRLNLNFKQYARNTLISARIAKRLQTLNEQKQMMALAEEIETTELSGPDKSESASKDDNARELCKTPSKSLIKGNYLKSPIRCTVKRKLIQSPSREKTHLRTETSDTNVPCDTKKRKLISEQSSQRKICGYSSDDLGKESSGQSKAELVIRKIFNTDKKLLKEKTQAEGTDMSPTKSGRKLSTNNVLKGKKMTVNHSNNSQSKIAKRPDSLEGKPDEGLTDSVSTSSNVDSDLLIVRNHFSENYDRESLTSVDKSVPLFVCETCNSVQYNLSDLKKHKNKHLRCQFCKLRLRTLESKKHHVENVCLLRKIMIDLPQVVLEKIDCNKTTRQSYPEAFVECPPLLQIENVLTVPGKYRNSIDLEETFFRGFPRERLNIIEILSEDETPPLPTEPYQTPIVPDITSNVLDNIGSKITDKEIVNNLPAIIRPPMKELGTQTTLPTDSDITITNNNRAFLKNLLPHLCMYGIPVTIQPGEFNVTYEYKRKLDPIKNLCLWGDLTPINIKSTVQKCDKNEVPNTTKDTETESSDTVP